MIDQSYPARTVIKHMKNLCAAVALLTQNEGKDPAFLMIQAKLPNFSRQNLEIMLTYGRHPETVPELILLGLGVEANVVN